MLPEEERDALLKTLQDTILQNVPSALETNTSDSVIAYQISKEGEPKPFCLLLIRQDHLEVRFPVCPSIVSSDSRFEKVDGCSACRLIVRKRTDIPGELLNIAIKAAAEEI